MRIHEVAQPGHPFTVTGSTGALLGLQNGSLEMWALPTKVFSNLRVRAELKDYPVPIDMNAAAASIDVEPDHTTITYSHAAITVRQHMFVPAGDTNAAKGAIVFFEIESVRPALVTISFEPAMMQQWPAPTYGRPSASWVPIGTGGAYVLSTDNPGQFGMVGMPGATVGEMAPYQERPTALPLEFKVRFDPVADKGQYFPLIAEVNRAGERNSADAVAAMGKRLAATEAALPEIYATTRAYYDHFFDKRLSVRTPDARFDKALRWAEIAIEQSKVRTGDETGLVAGWYPSFDSTRPGFGWYFGRDTLWTLYAVNSYGDQRLAKQALEFLAKRQRADGKMMHEYSLTAELLTGGMAWSRLGYEYAAADATPLFLMAVADYVRTTGDRDFLREHWDELKRAYAFDRAHDTDRVYDNSQGTGWVEAWPPKLPHQEIYLAALDGTSTAEMAEMAGLMGDADLAKSAAAQAKHIADAVARYRQADGRYAFSRNEDGTYDRTSTVFPSVALWTTGSRLPGAEGMLSAWSGHDFATDWGVRSVTDTAAVYDPISYHQGTVWPLFTGWASMAQYRVGRPMAGYQTLMRNVDLTWTGDPGFVTEVISGAFFEPLGRSSSHQLWSSAMVLSPAVRGLFGVDADGLHHGLGMHPQLPAAWDSAELDGVRVGEDLYHVELKRQGRMMSVTVRSERPTVLCLNGVAGADCREPATAVHRATLPLAAVEVGFGDQGLPEAGSATKQPRVVAETYEKDEVRLTMEGMAGTAVDLRVRRNVGSVRVAVDGGVMEGDRVHVAFPAGAQFVTKEVRISWGR